MPASASRFPQSRRLRLRLLRIMANFGHPPQDSRSRGDCGRSGGNDHGLFVLPPQDSRSRGDCGLVFNQEFPRGPVRLKIPAVAATAAARKSGATYLEDRRLKIPAVAATAAPILNGRCSHFVVRLKIPAVAATAACPTCGNSWTEYSASRFPQSRRLRLKVAAGITHRQLPPQDSRSRGDCGLQ